eukprot:TRINITY_DN4653_c0_g1_i2.p1 TRINITY_DN4653_c0_g1~~TRINITY_DN4653_c0_g1_i2.p1  ORF type:complete len:169 (+),score=47.64 TRINITY_DN4653_c0_g1_i2:57-563(+)
MRVFTDGACLNNGGPNAAAGIGVFWKNNSSWNRSEPVQGYRQTNQVAELVAIKVAIEIGRQRNLDNLLIMTDSLYALKCLTVWIHQWQQNGFTNLRGHPVVNQSLIQEIVEEMDDAMDNGMDITIRKVRGHSGQHGNEMANNLAREGAEENANNSYEDLDSDEDCSYY